MVALADGEEALQVWVTAVPEDNKANKALLKLLSKHFKKPVSAFTIVKGHTSRIKHVQIE